MTEDRDEERARAILRRSVGRATVPPFERLLTPRTDRRQQPLGRAAAMTLATMMVAIIALFAGRELATYRQQIATSATPAPAASPLASTRVVLPRPIIQPITRTSPAAQVAWVRVQGTDQSAALVGVDPAGTVVGRLDGGRYWRSADGALLYSVPESPPGARRLVGLAINVYSAADGQFQRSYPRSPQDAIIDLAFSPDGRWLALLGSKAYIQVIDLQSGFTQLTPLGYDPKASQPGLSGQPSGLTSSTLVFSEDSQRVYTIVDWAGPLSLTAFDVTPTGLVQTARAVDGQDGRKLPGCGGPGLAPKVVGGGQTLVLFCHVDGLISFIDLRALTSTTSFHAEQKNPFWLSPIFTPDGQLLYLHQQPAFGDFMQVVDLRSHALLGPVPTPKKIDEPGPFSWLFGSVMAGGVASTVPVAPDGSKLYSAASDGVTVLRIPDLKPVAKLAQGLDISEVWISGDGKTVFATDNGRGLYVIRESGGAPITVTLPTQIGGFVASEHG